MELDNKGSKCAATTRHGKAIKVDTGADAASSQISSTSGAGTSTVGISTLFGKPVMASEAGAACKDHKVFDVALNMAATSVQHMDTDADTHQPRKPLHAQPATPVPADTALQPKVSSKHASASTCRDSAACQPRDSIKHKQGMKPGPSKVCAVQATSVHEVQDPPNGSIEGPKALPYSAAALKRSSSGPSKSAQVKSESATQVADGVNQPIHETQLKACWVCHIAFNHVPSVSDQLSIAL